ncbi:MAG: protein translocase subunit SecF [Clostridia bacterium]|nr:protein translocase subunit SecF [Clostridia bacterium]
MNLTKKLANTKYDFVKTSKYYMLASVIILLAGIVCLCIHGVNLSIDFTGGTVVNIKAGDKLNNTATYNEYVERADDVLKDFGLEIAYHQKEGTEDSTTLQIRYQDIAGKDVDEMNEITNEVVVALQAEFTAEGEVVEPGNRITATASSRLILNALLAVAIASVLIVIYLAIRFKQVKYGICSIIGLLHDVLIVCAFMLIFNLEIGSVFIAALITVIGYSINNNVVIFDRMRENSSRYPNLSINELTNKSIAQSLTRTIITTLTTLIVIIVIAIVGVPSIGLFTLPIIIGITAGLYSSLFIVTPLWAMMSQNDKLDFKPKKKEKIEVNEDFDLEQDTANA